MKSIIFFIFGLVPVLSAADISDLTWEIYGGEVTITDCSLNATGDLIIPDTIEGFPVTGIGNYAFTHCLLDKIVIPDNVDSVGRRIFNGCASLTSISIGQNFPPLSWSEAVENCTRLTHVHVAVDNPNYQDIDGILFNKSLTVLSLFPRNRAESSYHIPDTVTSVSSGAFASCKNLASIELPDGLSSIESKAFALCTSLGTIEIPESVESIIISAFSGCTSLYSITVAPGNTNYQDIEGVLFNKSLEALLHYPASRANLSYRIPDSVTSIYGFSFASNPYLTGLIFGPNLNIESQLDFNHLPQTTFSSPPNLTSIEIHSDNPYFRSLDGVLFSKFFTTLITYPRGKPVPLFQFPPELSDIGNFAFANHQTLTEIIIPDTVLSIGEGAFSGCFRLNKISLGRGVSSIECDAFFGCTSLTHVDLPDNVNALGWPFFCLSAFNNLTNLTSISIGNNVGLLFTEDRADTFLPPSLEIVQFNEAPSPDLVQAVLMRTDTLKSVQVWPEDLPAFGGEGALWNGLPISLRNTTPRFDLYHVGETTSVFAISGGPNRTYILKYSTDLINYTPVATTPATITTDSSGTSSFTVNTSGAKSFYILEEAP